MTTTPITVDLARISTHPLLFWPLVDQDDVPIDVTPGTRKVELWYWEKPEDAGDPKRALWKKELDKLTPGTDGVRFSTDSTHQFYPDALRTTGAGARELVGWLRYYDSASTPIATDVWVKNALLVSAEDAPLDPA